MQGRGLTFAAVLLLGVLGVTFTVLHRQSHAVLVEADRGQRQLEFEDAAQALSEQARKAVELTRRVAEAEATHELSKDDLDSAARVEAFKDLQGLLGKLSRTDSVVGLRVLRGSLALAGFRRDGDRRTPLATPPPPPAALRATRESPGLVSLDLIRVDQAPLLQAATRTNRGLVILVELDTGPELDACTQAAEGGAWALVEGERVLWPLSTSTAPAAPKGPGRTVVEDDEVVASIGVPHAPWSLRARVPLSPKVGANKIPFLLAAFSAALVVWLGVRGARAVALQQTLHASATNERQLQAIFDAIANALIVVDPSLSVTRANTVALEAFGKDLIGKPYAEGIAAVRTDAPDDEVAQLRQILATGEPRHVELVTPRGRVWQVAQYPIFAPDLTIRGVVEHARDVTQTRLLQTQLVQSEKLSTLGEMAAGIAHEINNPIGVVSMFAQLLAEEIKETLGDDAPALEKVQLIEEQATNVGEIVKGLLRFARKSEGKKAPFDAREALSRALTIVSHQKILKAVELEQHVPDAPAIVLGDEGQLSQVILNLIVNGCHAMDSQGTLTITIRPRGPGEDAPPGRPFGHTDGKPQRLDVVIADQGKGIDQDELERIFEPFFTTKPAGVGTGLGLSVGFGIIRDHGGCIWVDSEIGKGTTFTLDLPAAETPPAESA